MNTHPPSPVSRRRADRWLHRFYFHGAGIHHYFARRCRPAGIALGIVLVLAACLVLGQHGRDSITQLFTLSLGMMMIGGAWALSRRASVEARRELPRFATAGEPLRYTVRVWHHGKRRLKRAWLADSPADPRPNLLDFTVLREP